MKVTAVLVHYHTPRLAAEAVDALRRDLAAAGLDGEIVIVDNGSSPEGRELLASLPVRLLEPGRNLGYSGGINLGLAESSGDVLVVMNPDVLVQPGCLGALSEVLSQGAAVVGPRFFLDRNLRLMIPPTERRRRRSALLTQLADRGEPWSRWARSRWRRHARRHWRSSGPLESFALSGALLAFHRITWERVGPFDEQYQLYFEEDDWLRRLERLGLLAQYVPAARAVHLYDRSAASEPRSRSWFATSQERFQRRWYGLWFVHLLRMLAAPTESRRPLPVPLGAGPPRGVLRSGGRQLTGSSPFWIEVAATVRGFPAVAERLSPTLAEDWQLPEEIWSVLAPGDYFVRLVDDRGRELACHAFVRPA